MIVWRGNNSVPRAPNPKKLDIPVLKWDSMPVDRPASVFSAGEAECSLKNGAGGLKKANRCHPVALGSRSVAPSRTKKTKVSAIIRVHRFSACRASPSAGLSAVALAKVEALIEAGLAQNWLQRRKIKPNQS
jgi:hypothetical protein